MNAAPVHPASRLHGNKHALTLVELLVVLALIFMMFAIIEVPNAGVQRNVKRNVEGSNLRAIGQMMLAAENDHPGALSAAQPADIHALAAQLARAGFNQPTFWLSKVDAANPFPAEPPTSILADPAADGTRSINPKFQDLPLAFAVALFPSGTDLNKLPPTTPLAWTRGLQPDGKWSKTAGTYGDWGGFIVYAGGNLERFKPEIDGKLVKFGTTQPTSDIREALPPGTRISEFPRTRER